MGRRRFTIVSALSLLLRAATIAVIVRSDYAVDVFSKITWKATYVGGSWFRDGGPRQG